VADGRLGGMVNRSTRIWDIVAPMVIVGEAGGTYTRVDGAPLALDTSAAAGERVYSVMAGAPALHRQMLALMNRQPTTGSPSMS
jgi:myo-inositol-1(or 4)-monophosphatase